MNQQHKKKLLEAVELAQKPGACQYVDESGNPLCVVAQVAHLEGLDVAKLVEGTYSSTVLGPEMGNYPFNKCPLHMRDDFALQKELEERGYDISMLHGLQDIWDGTSIRYWGNNERERMKYEVEQYKFSEK